MSVASQKTENASTAERQKLACAAEMSRWILMIRLCRRRDRRRNLANDVDDGAHTSLWRIFVIHMYAYGIRLRIVVKVGISFQAL